MDVGVVRVIVDHCWSLCCMSRFHTLTWFCVFLQLSGIYHVLIAVPRSQNEIARLLRRLSCWRPCRVADVSQFVGAAVKPLIAPIDTR